MKLKPVALCMIVILLFIFPSGSFQEMEIAAKRRDQLNPAIFKDTVVWEDWRNLRWDVFGYNLSESREVHVAKNARYAAVYEDVVVWICYGDQDTKIRGYTFSTGEEFQLATSSSISKSGTALYENIVVWVHTTFTSDIYGYDLETQKEIQIAARAEDQTNPAIYKNTVVWQDYRNHNWDIYGYDLVTLNEYQITANSYAQQNPALYETLVVWEDDRNANKDIYGYDLTTGKEFQITTDLCDQTNPAVYGDIIIWEDSRNGNKDIYGYIISLQQEFQVAVASGEQKNPALYGSTIIWEDYRSGDSDIYGLTLPSSPLDTDGDGHLYPDDCNDSDPEIHPGAQEPCDKKDNNCNGVIDEFCTATLEILVLNSQQREIEEARIFLDDAFQGKTNSEGKITLDVGALDYTVRVEAGGYSSQEKKVTVEKDMPTRVVFEMEPEGIPVSALGLLVSLVFCLLIIISVFVKLKSAKSTGSPPKFQSQMSLCPLCNAEVQEEWLVCPHCGADLTKKLIHRDETRIY